MKTTLSFYFITIVVFLTILGCSSNSSQTSVINGTWNLVNVGGGINGINDDYENGVIKWIFNRPEAFNLKVENNNFSSTEYDGLESGIYNYVILEYNGDFFLIIEGEEFGRYDLSDNNLLINQNETSTGSGADGYILKFER